MGFLGTVTTTPKPVPLIRKVRGADPHRTADERSHDGVLLAGVDFHETATRRLRAKSRSAHWIIGASGRPNRSASAATSIADEVAPGTDRFQFAAIFGCNGSSGCIAAATVAIAFIRSRDDAVVAFSALRSHVGVAGTAAHAARCHPRIERTIVITIEDAVTVGVLVRSSTTADAFTDFSGVAPTFVGTVEHPVFVEVSRRANEVDTCRNVQDRRIRENVNFFTEEGAAMRLPTVRPTELDGAVGSDDRSVHRLFEQGRLISKIPDEDLACFTTEVEETRTQEHRVPHVDLDGPTAHVREQIDLRLNLQRVDEVRARLQNNPGARKDFDRVVAARFETDRRRVGRQGNIAGRSARPLDGPRSHRRRNIGTSRNPPVDDDVVLLQHAAGSDDLPVNVCLRTKEVHIPDADEVSIHIDAGTQLQLAGSEAGNLASSARLRDGGAVVDRHTVRPREHDIRNC